MCVATFCIPVKVLMSFFLQEFVTLRTRVPDADIKK
jgi:hypothetical protein